MPQFTINNKKKNAKLYTSNSGHWHISIQPFYLQIQ